MSRNARGRPSPFRFVLVSGGELPRFVECPRQAQSLPGAKRMAKPWACDVGAKGTLTIEEKVELMAAPWSSWKPVAVGDVVNSVLTGWR